MSMVIDCVKVLFSLALVMVLPLAQLVSAETEAEHPRLAPVMTLWTHTTLDTSRDVDNFKVLGQQAGATPIFIVETGIGALCGCIHTLPFPPAVAVYDKSGLLLGAVIADPGATEVQFSVTAISDIMFISLTSAVPTDQVHQYTISIY